MFFQFYAQVNACMKVLHYGITDAPTISFHVWTVADPQSLLDEKEALEEKLALSQYELRLAQEDVLKLKTELENRSKGTLGERSGKSLNLITIACFCLI